jgi:hypothetical protein
VTVLGKRQVRLLTNNKVTESLKLGELNISMLSVNYLPYSSNGFISITIAVMSIKQGFIVTSLIEKSAD